MYFKQFLNDDLGCASYFIGDGDECVVVDPSWDITPYTGLAAERGMRIVLAIETHNHADHVSGHGKLAALGVPVAVFHEAGVKFPHKALKDGEIIEVGKVRLQVIHTPGHRPEHIAIAVSDLSRTEEPWLVLTGDSLFVGAVGRPDLAIEPEEGAEQLYKSLRERLLSLDDGVEVYPGHVAGSLCGKAMSDKGSSTIGFERRWNPPLQKRNVNTFVRSVTVDLPPHPSHFARIVSKNRGPFFTEDPEAPPVTPDEVDKMRKEGALVLDTRSPSAFGGGHIPGALNVYLRGGQFATRAAWIIPDKMPVVLVLETPDDIHDALKWLGMSGQEGVRASLLGGMHAWETHNLPVETTPQINVKELQKGMKKDELVLVDVREASEWREKHIPGALNVPFHALQKELDSLPAGRELAVICGSGIRSSIAASILQAHSLSPHNVMGGMDAWEEMGGELV